MKCKCSGVVLALAISALMLTLAGCGAKSPVGGTPQLVSVEITPSSASIPKGLTQQFSVAIRYSDNTRYVLDTAAWSSSVTTVASVNSTGKATGVDVGTSIISVNYDGRVGTASLTVTPPVVSSIAVTPSTPSVPLGLGQQFTATATMSDATTQDRTATTAWQSSSTTVATITAGGLVATLTEGTSTISATSEGKTGSTTLTVAPPAVVSIAVTSATPSIYAGTAQQFKATATMTNATTPDVTATATWESSNTTVATMDTTTPGLVHGVAGGTTTISATQGGHSGPGTLTVNAAASYAYVLVGDQLKTYGILPGQNMVELASTGVTGSSMVSDGANFLYLTTDSGSSIEVYRINRVTGALTAVAPFALATGKARLLALEPLHQWLYAFDPSDAAHPLLRTFRVNSTTGELTDVGISLDFGALSWAAPVSNNNIEFLQKADATIMYWNGYDTTGASVNQGYGWCTLFGYNVDRATGALGQHWDSPYTAPSARPYAITISSDGQTLYSALEDDRIAVWPLDPSTGIPTGTNTIWGPGGGEPILAMASKAGAAYIYAGQGQNLLQLTNDGTGALSVTSTTLVPDRVAGLVMDEPNSLLYVLDNSGIAAHTINTDGGPTRINRIAGYTAWVFKLVVIPNPLQ